MVQNFVLHGIGYEWSSQQSFISIPLLAVISMSLPTANSYFIQLRKHLSFIRKAKQNLLPSHQITTQSYHNTFSDSSTGKFFKLNYWQKLTNFNRIGQNWVDKGEEKIRKMQITNLNIWPQPEFTLVMIIFLHLWAMAF